MHLDNVCEYFKKLKAYINVSEFIYPMKKIALVINTYIDFANSIQICDIFKNDYDITIIHMETNINDKNYVSNISVQNQFKPEYEIIYFKLNDDILLSTICDTSFDILYDNLSYVNNLSNILIKYSFEYIIVYGSTVGTFITIHSAKMLGIDTVYIKSNKDTEPYVEDYILQMINENIKYCFVTNKNYLDKLNKKNISVNVFLTENTKIGIEKILYALLIIEYSDELKLILRHIGEDISSRTQPIEYFNEIINKNKLNISNKGEELFKLYLYYFQMNNYHTFIFLNQILHKINFYNAKPYFFKFPLNINNADNINDFCSYNNIYVPNNVTEEIIIISSDINYLDKWFYCFKNIPNTIFICADVSDASIIQKKLVNCTNIGFIVFENKKKY